MSMYRTKISVTFCNRSPTAKVRLSAWIITRRACRSRRLFPTRGLIGFETDLVNLTRGEGFMSHLFREYAPFKGEIGGRGRGVMVSMEPGVSTAYALNNIQERGRLFIGPQEDVYAGMIVGENARPEDLPVNPCKAKHLTNMRSQGDGKGIQLEAPLRMSLERAIEYIDVDEYVEATPKSLRLRKRILDATARKRAMVMLLKSADHRRFSGASLRDTLACGSFPQSPISSRQSHMSRQYTLQRAPVSTSVHIDYAAELNEQQLAAVTAPPGPILVIAGAGSGKTRTLTYRVAYLLENGIDPRNILLLTFTNKAAREMLNRVANLLPVDASGLWGGTFHSVGNRILRRHGTALGYSSGFTIMDREDQKDLINTVVASAGIDPKEIRFPKGDVLAEIFSFVVNTEMPLEALLAEKFPYFLPLLDKIQDVRDRYEKKKKATNSVDFDDLLQKTLLMFQQHERIAEIYRRQFQFILVDEYQDTNKIQADLVDLLARDHRNLMVVGDDAQSIYSWRGANFQNILEFPKRYPDAQVFKIEMNYRSVPEILEVANAAIAANVQQFRKHLSATRESKTLRPALVALNDGSEQAQFVAQRILELRDENIDLNDIAVLYRAHYHALELQLELSRRGIPYQITSGIRFFEQAHIKDVTSFIRFVANPRDEVAFNRMVKLLPGIGNRTAENLWQAWKAV